MPKKPERRPRKPRVVAPNSPETSRPAPPAESASGAAGAALPAVAVPPKRLPPGTTGSDIALDVQSLQRLVTAVAEEGSAAGQQVWSRDSSELAVITGKVTVALDDGLIVVTIPVSCDQLASASIQVPFAAGGKDSPSGMVLATEERPRGPEMIVDLWGEALTAFAWRLLVAVMYRVALQSGVDEDGAGLVPIAVTAAKDGLTLLPMARHAFDRVRP
jgi:hypothetical protein